LLTGNNRKAEVKVDQRRSPRTVKRTEEVTLIIMPAEVITLQVGVKRFQK
jgi:hypothetical protein